MTAAKAQLYRAIIGDTADIAEEEAQKNIKIIKKKEKKRPIKYRRLRKKDIQTIKIQIIYFVCSVLLPERFGFSLAPSAPDCTGFSRVDLRVRSFFGIPSVSLIGNDYII